MEKYLILLSPSLSQDLFGNNTISPPWQLFATSPVCFWHRHLHPPEKLHHKLYTFTFWSFFQNMFFVFTNIYTRLKNCTTNCTPLLFGHFFQDMFFVFTNIYTCLRNCTTNPTPSLVCCFVWQNMFFVLLAKIYTCLIYLQVYVQFVILRVFSL